MRLLLDTYNLLEFQAKESASVPRAEKPTEAFVCHMAGSLCSKIVLALLGWACLTASTLQALEATFNSATDIPVTAASYTATGEATFTLGFLPTPGTNLTVVKNTGLPFVSGEFSNLANGATISLTHNGTIYPFVAWYYGGEGNNDLVLLWPYTGLAAWGDNFDGQLGIARGSGFRIAPVSVEQTGALLGKTIVQVACGRLHTLALCSDGTVAAWGQNFAGQLGDNSTTNRLAPVTVNVAAGTSALAGKTVIAVAVGFSHSLALCSDGTVTAWGDNIDGQLGDYSETRQMLVPVAVRTENGISALFGKTVIAIAAGDSHSLALCSDGSLVAWGSNTSGQLANSTPTPYSSSTPVAVFGLSALFGKTVTAIAAGARYNLALCSDGTVAAWGHNSSGQLGDNTLIGTSVPVAVNVANGTSALFGRTVVAVAAGSSHSLAWCSDGTLAAWGGNSVGQLGNNSTTGSSVPVAVNATSGLSSLFDKTVVAVTAGASHSLALCSDGTVAAWGYNNSGQLGNKSFTLTGSLVPVAVNTEVGVSVLAGKQVSRLAAGTAASSSFAIFGTTMPEIEVEVLEPSVTELADQASTVDFGSTLAAGRTFKVRNSGGVPLANLSATLTGADAASFTLIRQPSATVAAGNTTTFQVAFTGVNSGAKSATLEITSNDSDESPFQINLVGNRIARLEATFAGGSDIPLSAPSINLSGTEVQLTLNYVPALGTNLTVIKNTGTAFIAGQFSNLANGARVSLSHNGINYPFIAWYYGGAGNNDLVLLWPYAGLAAWGKNSDGQLGINTTQQSLVPVGVVQTCVLYGKTIVQVAHGNGHSLALCSDGSVAAWGANYQGQLGDNSTTRQVVPVAVNLANGISALYGKTVIAVAAGYAHSLALCSDGTVAAWGYNGTSTLGDNSTVRRLVPVAVNMASGTSALFGKTVVAVAAGRNHSLALCSDGTVTAWGYNEYGQLGDNTPTYGPVPVAVNVAIGTSALYDKTVVSIAAGNDHSLALCSDATLAGWGYNSAGQLGDNSTTQRLAPVSVDVAGGRSALYGKTVSAVTAGASHSLALCSDGTMAAWGSNAFGQLGDGSRTQSLVPVAVNVESGTSSLAGRRVIDITAGHEHTLALCNDGTLSAWGYNYNGQLGRVYA